MSLHSTTLTIEIYIKLAQYPISADLIRAKMRALLFARGMVDKEVFEQEIEQMALDSQRREGSYDPFHPEAVSVWLERKRRIREFHTDYCFAYNLPPELLDQLIEEVIRPNDQDGTEATRLTFNPELAPWEMLFKQGELYEKLPPLERAQVEHHLEEIKVVLIRGMITDQLPLIGVAKRVLSIADLRGVYQRRVGKGKIGGKAAGMLIAWKCLQHPDPAWADLSQHVAIPDSYYLGTDVMYHFRQINQLDEQMNQKYKPLEQIRAGYERVIQTHLESDLPPDVEEALAEILRKLGRKPLIVRSSSLLEDSFGTAFAGKYHSYFCPNQGSAEENLAHLIHCIKLIYASTLSPDALFYRRQHGLLDYDERMAILLQEVKGDRWGDYFFPTVAGVAFSQNPFRWHPTIRKEEGFLRLVWGMGTRAVERVAQDYPRLVALSHPTLRPETNARAIQQYSQHTLDAIDLGTNRFCSLEVSQLLRSGYPYLRYIASLYRDGFVQPLVSSIVNDQEDQLLLTFDPLLQTPSFVRLFRQILQRLEESYQHPVDVEFTVEIVAHYPAPDFRLQLLQCRPLSQRPEGEKVTIPQDVRPQHVLFRDYHLVPHGVVGGIGYVVWVDHEQYGLMEDRVQKREIGRIIGRLNKRLERERFILMGPGRWGSANLDLGVNVSYADIYNTKVLIEIATPSADGGKPELSYGTHFFQDLVEAGIYALPLHLEDTRSFLRTDLLRQATNLLPQLSPQDTPFAPYVRVISIRELAHGRQLTIYMDSQKDETQGILMPEGT